MVKMINRLLILLIGIAFVGCSAADENTDVKIGNDSMNVTEIESDTTIEKASDIKGVVIPYLGEFKIEEMTTDSIHEYFCWRLRGSYDT